MGSEILKDLASEQEIRAAVEQEVNDPSSRIAAGAVRILRRNPRLREQMTPLQLVSLAYEAILSTRAWNKNVAFPLHVFRVMRSLANNDSRKIKTTLPQIVYGQEEYDDQINDDDDKQLPSPEDMLIQQQTVEARVSKLRSFLHKDATALEILNLFLEHGLSKAEIRSKLQLSNTKFWSADRKIQRAVEKLGDE